MDKIVLNNTKQFKAFANRIFGPDHTLEEPKQYPCLCVYLCKHEWDRTGDVDIEVTEYVYPEDFNKRHRRECDIKAAAVRRENKKAAAAWRLQEPETFVGLSDCEVLDKVWKRAQARIRAFEGKP